MSRGSTWAAGTSTPVSGTSRPAKPPAEAIAKAVIFAAVNSSGATSTIAVVALFLRMNAWRLIGLALLEQTARRAPVQSAATDHAGLQVCTSGLTADRSAPAPDTVF